MSVDGPGFRSRASVALTVLCVSLFPNLVLASTGTALTSLTQLATCGTNCVFWKGGNPPTMSRTGNCTSSCTSLYLGYMGIARIADGTFVGLTALRQLYLNNNQISALDNNTFVGLAGLQTLYLNSNQITTLADGTFTVLTDLQYLSLHGNRITNRMDSTLDGLTKLRYLYLAGNPGEPFACPSVSEQSSGCEINKVGKCGECTFWVNGRSWVLSKTGSCLSSCTYLFLGSQGIAVIATGTFAGLPSLQNLYLDNNQITAIADGTFAGLTGLQRLSLNNNQITTLTNGTFAGLGGLHFLSLSRNTISALAETTFTGLAGLQMLYLDNNQVTALPATTLRGLPNLQYLLLGGNPGVPFECPAVSQQSSGCELDLTKCGECSFWVDGRSWMLSRTGSCESSCTSLWLDSKGIASIANDTFAGLPGLQFLYLSNNQIASLDDNTMSMLPNLHTLWLSGNPGAPFACPQVSQSSAGCEINRVLNCGGCSFWVDGRSWVLSKTGSCESSCTSLWLSDVSATSAPSGAYSKFGGQGIMSVAQGTFDDMAALKELNIGVLIRSDGQQNVNGGVITAATSAVSLGCVPGVAAAVAIDPRSTAPTPRCPANCSTETYYDRRANICMRCPAGFHAHGIGVPSAENCTYDPTTSSAETAAWQACGGMTRPFTPAAGGSVICVPEHIYPAAEVQHVAFAGEAERRWTWKDVRGQRDVSGQKLFRTGALGKMMIAGWEVWVCARHHPAIMLAGDSVCFTYSEEYKVFVPWGYGSVLHLLVT